MAKKPTVAIASLNLAALAIIVAAGENGTFAPLAEVQNLADADPALIEINSGNTDANGHVAVRATPAGIAKASEGSAPAPVVTKSAFAVGAVPDFILEAAVNKKRVSRGGEKYPFDALDLTGNRGFFVPATADMPEPAKSLASTVSSAIARYAVEAKDANGNVVTEQVTVPQYQTDAEGKRVKDAEGHWIKTGETVETRNKMEPTRQFRLVPVDASEGQPAGAWVVRTA